ncbi:MAG: DUF805 domain-containing protein [Pseudomonadota bacterium]
MTDIFISCVPEDEAEARQLGEALEAVGFTVWPNPALAEDAPNPAKIEKALKTARCVLVLWSEYSIASEKLMAEAGEAHRLGTLLQVRLDRSPLPFQFRTLPCVEMAGWQGNADGAAFQHLVERINVSAMPFKRAAKGRFPLPPLPTLPLPAVPGFAGRMRRVPYFISWLVLVSAILGLYLAYLDMPKLSPAGSTGVLVAFILTIILFVIFSFSCMVRRLHDIGLSGWWSVLVLVPYAEYFLFGVLIFWKGTDGPNRFGDPPSGFFSKRGEKH